MSAGILALDVATSTGWAFGEPGAAPLFGSFRAGRPELDDGEIYAAFRKWLNELIDLYLPAIVVFESPYLPRGGSPKMIGMRSGKPVFKASSQINMSTIRRLVTLTGIVDMTASERGLICREEAPSSITKIFTGVGGGKRVDKKASVMAVCNLYGWAPKNDNEGDALAIFAATEAVMFPFIRRSAGRLFASMA